MTKLSLNLLLTVLLGLTATGCGSEAVKASPALRDSVTVTGEFGARPELKLKAPVAVPETTVWTETKGDGDKVGATATAILQLTLADARTGKTAVSTFDGGQRPLEVQLGESVFPALTKALTGVAAGTRVVVASTSDDAYGDQGAPQIGIKGGDPLVIVADILSTDPTSVLPGPTGATLAPSPKAPRMLERDGEPIGFDFTGLRKPKKLVVVPLREGTGPAIENPDRVTANYLGQVWKAKSPFESSFTSGPATYSVGLGGTIKAWEQGLIGVREGSRVLLLCPPALAYGKREQPGIPSNSTLVFVIDVLGVG
ncbi:MAG: FKBP-type peptidyl-prolyl cis-trans isomerase [Marmoricola sp.]